MVKRRHSTWPVPKSIFKLNIPTKKATANVLTSPVCTDVSIKVRRTQLRRSALSQNNSAQPVCYSRDPQLSAMYDRSLSEPYVSQLYVQCRKIGEGSFGDVFVAYSEEDSDYCAIKISNDSHPFVDFNEVKRWEKVPQHENCVQFKRAWYENHHLYIHMELCMCSLDKLLNVDHFIREIHCWNILLDICRGLKNLHDNNLVHMDIKPANIMLTRSGICKLGDFGLLCDLNEKVDFSNHNKSGLSISEGDGKYVALEVLRQGIQTKAADIFSLGIMMMEVASDAVMPSSGENWEGLRNGRLPLCYLRRKLSRNFRKLINSMIRSDYNLRPTVDDILQNKTMLHIIAEQNDGQRINYVNDWARKLCSTLYYRPLHVINTSRDRDEGPSHSPECNVPLVDTPRLTNNNENEDPMRFVESSATRLRRVSRRLFES